MKAAVAALLALVVLMLFALLAERAMHYERTLDNRVLQLELHDCGLTQFEDYSVAFQRDDATRLRCVAAMRP